MTSCDWLDSTTQTRKTTTLTTHTAMPEVPPRRAEDTTAATPTPPKKRLPTGLILGPDGKPYSPPSPRQSPITKH